jgi:SAM-dependent methyltransferase
VENGWSEDRDFYLSLAGSEPISILDLGCGTGLLCEAYARAGHDVTGADPTAAMLDVARARPFGDRIEWVQASAQDFQSEKTFDLVIMTGHAFQVLLEDEDILRTFAAVRAHLKQAGRFVFESRNPAIDWHLLWNGRKTLETAIGTVLLERHVLSRIGDRIIFDTHYHVDGQTLTSRSELAFPTREKIDGLLLQAGLRTDSLIGNWHGGGFDAALSEEIIVSACL